MSMGANVSMDNETVIARHLHAEIIATVNSMAGLDCIWPRGLVHQGGPHFRLRGSIHPISIGVDECLAFARLIAAFRPANGYIIGNAFGVSSVFIARIMELYGGRSVITLDSKSEGDGEHCFEIASRLRERMNAKILVNRVGWSPQDIANTAEGAPYDLIFIDGDHSHPQVTRDFEGVLSITHPRSILCWHDYWVDGVPQSVAAAQATGYQCLKINTSCEMIFGTRAATDFDKLKSVFPDGVPPMPHHRSLRTWTTLAISFGAFLWSRARNGRPKLRT